MEKAEKSKYYLFVIHVHVSNLSFQTKLGDVLHLKTTNNMRQYYCEPFTIETKKSKTTSNSSAFFAIRLFRLENQKNERRKQ